MMIQLPLFRFALLVLALVFKMLNSNLLVFSFAGQFGDYADLVSIRV